MNAHAMALAAYGNPRTALKPARTAEYDVIARITHRLRKGMEKGAMSFPELAAAMHENRRLWIEFASDLGSPGNALPADLKLQLLQLARFTLLHTDEVLAGRADAEILIEINTLIMRGLAGKDV